MSSLIEVRTYHLPQEVNDAAADCSIQLDSPQVRKPLTEFLSACAQTDPIMGLALELRRPGANGRRLGIYVILPQGVGLPDAVCKPHSALVEQIQELRVPLIIHASFVYASLGKVEEKLAHLEDVSRTNYRLGFIPMVVDG